jgi:hypothetical protein
MGLVIGTQGASRCSSPGIADQILIAFYLRRDKVYRQYNKGMSLQFWHLGQHGLLLGHRDNHQNQTCHHFL